MQKLLNGVGPGPHSTKQDVKNMLEISLDYMAENPLSDVFRDSEYGKFTSLLDYAVGEGAYHFRNGISVHHS